MQWGVRQFKGGFFDAEGVKRAADADTRRVFSKFGAFVRQRIRSSLRYSKKPSSAGSPPAVHRSDRFTRTRVSKGVAKSQPSSPLRELVFFALDQATGSVVIGPAKFGSTGAPGRLEKGGAGSVLSASGARKAAHYRKFPFVGPAGKAEAQRLPQIIRGRA